MTIVRRGDDFLPLGINRFRILECIGGNDTRSAVFFDLPPGKDIIDAFETYFAALNQRDGFLAHRGTRLLLSAASLLSGNLGAADTILDELPAELIRLDHGSGYFLTAHLVALAVAVPFPENLRDTNEWLAGSATQNALRSWLAANRDTLRWNKIEGKYHHHLEQ